MLIDLINHQEYTYEVWLCKPYFPYEVIGYVDAINLTYKAVFNDDDDSMSFDAIYHYYDNQVNEVTKKLIENSILLVTTKIDDETISQKYFIVNKAIEYGADQEKKKVSAMALESTLGNKTINGFKGTRKLYDGQIFDFEDHTKGGILDYINQYKLNSQWTIQMSPSLENVYMTVREDNFASLGLAASIGFVYVTKNWFRDHWTLTLGRRRDHVGRSNSRRM
jgi:hypothetical protein